MNKRNILFIVISLVLVNVNKTSLCWAGRLANCTDQFIRNVAHGNFDAAEGNLNNLVWGASVNTRGMIGAFMNLLNELRSEQTRAQAQTPQPAETLGRGFTDRIAQLDASPQVLTVDESVTRSRDEISRLNRRIEALDRENTNLRSQLAYTRQAAADVSASSRSSSLSSKPLPPRPTRSRRTTSPAGAERSASSSSSSNSQTVVDEDLALLLARSFSAI